MRRAWIVIATSVGLGLAMLSLLLAALSIAVSRPDGVVLYGALAVASGFLVFWLMKRERRGRRSVSVERRPGRAPIRLPVRAAGLTFLGWYAATLAVEYAVNGRLLWIDVAAIAPFAAFMLTVLTFAGRHIAFRLTAEERNEGT
jgi:hypothetical protein